MQLEQFVYALVGNTLYVPADRGLAVNHTLVLQVWAVAHM